MSRDNTSWMEPISRSLAQADADRGFILVFPEYRPDLVRELASRLNLRFYDYRENHLRPLGPDAFGVQLDDLDKQLSTLEAEGGAVVFNVEALLATKKAPERARWLSGFLEKKRGALLVLPLTLFGEDLAPESAQVLQLEAETLPEQSLLSRFLH